MGDTGCVLVVHFPRVGVGSVEHRTFNVRPTVNGTAFVVVHVREIRLQIHKRRVESAGRGRGGGVDLKAVAYVGKQGPRIVHPNREVPKDGVIPRFHVMELNVNFVEVVGMVRVVGDT